MRLADLDFDLPAERIAQHPLPRRDASRLLVVERATGRIEDARFRDFPRHLDRGDLVVFNETRVIPARLTGTRPTGGRVEVLLTRDRGGGRWEALVRPGRKVRLGEEIVFGSRLRARVAERLEQGGRVIEFSADSSGASGTEPDPLAPAEERPLGRGGPASRGGRPRSDADGRPDATRLRRELERAGAVPLPPYIRRLPVPADRRRYQTVYARKPGAVAAPTAGLHFTSATFRSLRERGMRTARVCLHVGPGTFRPVEVEDPARHRMDAEPFEIGRRTAAALAGARARGARICCVGTTTVRAIETAARVWDAPGPLAGETDLFIRPPFEFLLTDALLTNFHLPRSTLLLLVAAFAGAELTHEAYRHALGAGYRFYSYGDAMLIL